MALITFTFSGRGQQKHRVSPGGFWRRLVKTQLGTKIFVAQLPGLLTMVMLICNCYSKRRKNPFMDVNTSVNLGCHDREILETALPCRKRAEECICYASKYQILA